MLRSGNSLRFTPGEIEEARKLGLDYVGVKTQADLSNAAITFLITALEERPALFDKIARGMAQAKGVKLPPILSVVPSPDSAER